ncbi:g_PROTEIN_RECEP_F1_2 domain-containing protein [Caerostris extrusa]|uniref:G_PROTEIN_RECEP_F1_2 domain-containing protein n=1 Tax=Caerostris extrusa TaxID=172846 RepID=A0AAV4T6Y9_CAEEX|nr:g_PROTEIN_RECEP_F1_2 domain-containing protein [Caerostris extrusa]
MAFLTNSDTKQRSIAVQETSSTTTTTTTTESDNDWYSYFISTPAPYINHQSLVSPLTKNTHSSKPTSVPEIKPSNDVVSLAIYSALAIGGSLHDTFNNHISPFVCYWQWYIALQSFGTSCFNYFFIALENLLRAYRSRRKDSRNKNIGAYSYFCGVKVVIVLVVFFWTAPGLWLLALDFYDNNFDVCNRRYGYNRAFWCF